MDILGYNIDTSLPSVALKGQTIINTINPHSYYVAKKDQLFKLALNQSDILVPDGIGFVYAAKFLHGVSVNRIAGADIHQHFLHFAQDNKFKVFYLGSSENILQRIVDKIKVEYPLINTATYSPPYQKEFSDIDNFKMTNAINSFVPDILFVGMTAPKQEKWVYLNKSKVNAKIICSVGAVFDFYSGSVKRPNDFWIKFRLEWLMRFIREPKRLWRRNFISMPVFLWDLLRYKFGLLKTTKF